ncbi:stage III sporulation protein AA [Lutispora sp.]|uniref:stage III sporulation protein AA n=1 Tax=Lutispora sp. TaxID=2828727 RepID=UPI003561F08C
MQIKNTMDEIIDFLPPKIKWLIRKCTSNKIHQAEEIRLRLGKPLIISGSDWDFFIDDMGYLTKEIKNAYITTKDDIRKASEIIQGFSVYSFGEELKNGYITIPGGHRIGISGRAVIDDGNVKTIKDISFINYRIAKEIIGAADKAIPYIIAGNSSIYNTLIISPPQCGKTTLLRDIVRQLSNGIKSQNIKGFKIGLVDERSEIAACFLGEPRNDVGIRTDVLDACPKSQGIIMLIRSMSPDIIATDEIGRKEDADALMEGANAGVKIIATMHGSDIDDLFRKIELKKLHSNYFERILVLGRSKGVGTIEKIYDREGRILYLNT